MVPPSNIAAALAVVPSRPAAEPRVIQQFTSIFLVSRRGDLWRVYDSATPDGAERRMPSASSTHPYRLFLALARRSELRVHAFAPDESREVDPVSLQEQLGD
ncbi:MAG TPA: hypothetical protein VH277_03985 [Gemmatimonadaceae bacterium]|nr:hypothetical protein [Gemmatimonadaceae bacterium]